MPALRGATAVPRVFPVASAKALPLSPWQQPKRFSFSPVAGKQCRFTEPTRVLVKDELAPRWVCLSEIQDRSNPQARAHPCVRFAGKNVAEWRKIWVCSAISLKALQWIGK
jgi:hypothetical protein